MLDFGDAEVRVLLLEVVGIDQYGLVSEKLLAGGEVLGEEFFSLWLYYFFVLMRYGVPKFGFSLVDEVYSWQVEVLGVPAEEGFPTA